MSIGEIMNKVQQYAAELQAKLTKAEDNARFWECEAMRERASLASEANLTVRQQQLIEELLAKRDRDADDLRDLRDDLDRANRSLRELEWDDATESPLETVARLNGEVLDMIEAQRMSNAELAATRKENEELRTKLKVAADSAGKGIQENLEMRLTNHTQCQKIRELNTEIHHLTSALNAAQKGITLAHGELGVARTTLSTLNRQKDELEHKLVTATQTIGTLEETARELRSWLNARDAQVAALNNDIARKGHFAAQMVMRAEQAEKDRAVAETKLAKAQHKIGEMYVQQNLHGKVAGSQFEDRIKELESYLNNVCSAAGTESYDNLFDVVTYQRTAAKALLGVLTELKGYVHPDLHYDYTIHLTHNGYVTMSDVVNTYRNMK